MAEPNAVVKSVADKYDKDLSEKDLARINAVERICVSNGYNGFVKSKLMAMNKAFLVDVAIEGTDAGLFDSQ